MYIMKDSRRCKTSFSICCIFESVEVPSASQIANYERIVWIKAISLFIFDMLSLQVRKTFSSIEDVRSSDKEGGGIALFSER